MQRSKVTPLDVAFKRPKVRVIHQNEEAWYFGTEICRLIVLYPRVMVLQDKGVWVQQSVALAAGTGMPGCTTPCWSSVCGTAAHCAYGTLQRSEHMGQCSAVCAPLQHSVYVALPI